MDASIPVEDVPSNVQLTEADRGDLTVHADNTADNDKERPSERGAEMCLRAETECENECVGIDLTSNHATSVEEMQEDMNTNGISKAVKKHPGRKVAQARDWILIIAAILKERVKDKVWEGIVDGWVILQRYWDSVEVSSFQMNPIPYK